MSYSLNASSDSRVWDALKLDELIQGTEWEYVNEWPDDAGTGEGSGEGWGADIIKVDNVKCQGDMLFGFYAVIFTTSYANDHSPGASHYTDATLYNLDQPDDVREYAEELERWQSAPETHPDYEPEEEEEEDEEEEEESDAPAAE